MGLYQAICKIIKEQRISSHLTQGELADKCSLTKSDISRIENEIGNPSVDKLDKIIDALSVKVSEIKIKKVK